MENDKFQMFQNRFAKVYKHKSRQAKRLSVSCFRIYDHDLPEFPFCIELYDDKIYLAEYRRNHGMSETEHEVWLQHCILLISEMTSITQEKIFLRERKKMNHRENQQYEKVNAAKDFFKVKENGLSFLVNLTDYLDTGLFLDHRITRELVKKEATDKRVLNLFCYTGSFSVYAASGNAKSVASVDLSKTYLNWAEDNFYVNDFNEKNKYFFIHADVKEYLKSLAAKSFDLIILDPPTFSNSKRMKDFLDIQRDHVELINDSLYALSENGIIYFSTNFSKFILDKANIHTTKIKEITKATTPFDFDGKLKRWCFRIEK